MKVALALAATLALAGCATPRWMAEYPAPRSVVRHEAIRDKYGVAIAHVVEHRDGRVVIVDKFGRTLAHVDAR